MNKEYDACLHVKLPKKCICMDVYKHAYIKEYGVAVGVSVMLVNTKKPLRELDIAHPLSNQWIHHETHCLSKSLTIIDVVITIQVQQMQHLSAQRRL
jgi:hypothetical protein